jgi:hypothetical protein
MTYFGQGIHRGSTGKHMCKNCQARRLWLMHKQIAKEKEKANGKMYVDQERHAHHIRQA